MVTVNDPAAQIINAAYNRMLQYHDKSGWAANRQRPKDGVLYHYTSADGLKRHHRKGRTLGDSGPRSGQNRDVFCEIAPVDEFLCCRLCAFQQVCSASDILRLPCNAV
jgi:hypothetical protein